jgi:hypothetical protein
MRTRIILIVTLFLFQFTPALAWFPHGSPSGGGACPMTGIFDLTNTCNNIYFIGGLK